MDRIKVIITNNQKTVKIPTGLRLLIRRCCNAVLVNEEFKGDAEINVSLVDNEEIQILNKKFREKDYATDVLSFPLGENGVYDVNPENGAFQLGDVVISIEKAYEQAGLYGHSLQREVGFLTVHSVLHLLGYDHEQGGIDALRMREKEEEIMLKLGLPRGASYVISE
ncbi:MAG: rRNA maturation RNase YbeY [Oscillospiraceae bacterium]|nr:rRNA maturation RNase YbeY [Oscillospiraceae bacterium]MBQ8731905.1 rRNA maturation RNase YbeY [Oscillospiraceae bacterium]